MAVNTYLTQQAIEVWEDGPSPPLNLTQQVVEVFVDASPPLYVTQQAVEVFAGGTPHLNLTQQIVEVWYAPMRVTTHPIRRLRRFMLPWDDANRMKFLSRLELVMQTGIGTTTTTSPTVMLRLSKDGGMTWGNEILMNAGPMGAFDTRVYANRLSRARNWVAEVSVSDPVDWQFLQCLADYEEGTS